jgi:prepilin-type N-terminal cleavage/methylation domain-containing protein
MNHARDIRTPETSDRAAFTLVDLLVVLAIIALLATIAYPALANTRNNGHVARCLNNLRRLTAGWTIYVDDNSDRMITGASPVSGALDWTASQSNTNKSILVDPVQSLLAQYVKDASLYKCPADQYQSPANLGPRARSVSMSAALGGSPQLVNLTPGRTYFSARKTSELTTPGPTSIFVFLDEHPDSINDSTFHVILGSLPANGQFRDLPGSFHNSADSVSFADGHCDLKRWSDSRTLKPVSYIGFNNTPVPNSEDYLWLNDHSPYKN